MKKLSKIILIFMLIMILGSQYVCAAKQTLPRDVEETLEEFLENLEDGDTEVYNYFDTTNTELYNNVNEYLDEIEIDYKIKDFKEENGIYYIDAKITASGQNWNVSGFTTTYELKKYGLNYIIIDTDLFDSIGTENIFNRIIRIILIVFGILFVAFIVIAVIVLIVVKSIIKAVKKKENNNQ